MLEDDQINTNNDQVDLEQFDAMPLWVRVLGFICFALLLLFVILHLTGNSLGGQALHGGHGM